LIDACIGPGRVSRLASVSGDRQIRWKPDEDNRLFEPINASAGRVTSPESCSCRSFRFMCSCRCARAEEDNAPRARVVRSGLSIPCLGSMHTSQRFFMLGRWGCQPAPHTVRWPATLASRRRPQRRGALRARQAARLLHCTSGASATLTSGVSASLHSKVRRCFFAAQLWWCRERGVGVQLLNSGRASIFVQYSSLIASDTAQYCGLAHINILHRFTNTQHRFTNIQNPFTNMQHLAQTSNLKRLLACAPNIQYGYPHIL